MVVGAGAWACCATPIHTYCDPDQRHLTHSLAQPHMHSCGKAAIHPQKDVCARCVRGQHVCVLFHRVNAPAAFARLAPSHARTRAHIMAYTCTLPAGTWLPAATRGVSTRSAATSASAAQAGCGRQQGTWARRCTRDFELSFFALIFRGLSSAVILTVLPLGSHTTAFQIRRFPGCGWCPFWGKGVLCGLRLFDPSSCGSAGLVPCCVEVLNAAGPFSSSPAPLSHHRPVRTSTSAWPPMCAPRTRSAPARAARASTRRARTSELPFMLCPPCWAGK